MLVHADVKTTQVYAQIVDEKKDGKHYKTEYQPQKEITSIFSKKIKKIWWVKK